MRTAVPVVLLGLLTGCMGVSSENKATADAFYNNARTYYKGRDYVRAMNQIERGLQADPDHYQLNLLEGWVLLQESRSHPELFTKALAVLDRMRGMRSESSQDYRLWLGLGQAHQGLYQLRRREALRLHKAADIQETPAETRVTKLAQAEEKMREFHAHLADARRYYTMLLDREDGGAFPAYERLFILETDYAVDLKGEAKRKQLEVAAKRAKTYLDANHARQEHYKVMLTITQDVEQERFARRTLAELKARERAFRGTYATLLYSMNEFQRAHEQFDRVLEIDPTRAAGYYNRARCAMKLDQTAAAREDLQNFLRLTKRPFDSPEVTEANRLLEQLASSSR